MSFRNNPSTRYKRQHHTCQSRRRFLQFGAALTTTLTIPNAMAKLAGATERKLSLYNLHTGESLQTTYWAEGQYQQAELAAINHILRDHRSGEIHPMDPRLLDLMSELHQHTNSKQPFHIISGYRCPATNAMLHQHSKGVAKHSMHMQGKAVDIRLPDCQLSKLHKAAMSCHAGGVGYYQKSNFVHIDTGRVRHWG